MSMSMNRNDVLITFEFCELMWSTLCFCKYIPLSTPSALIIHTVINL